MNKKLRLLVFTLIFSIPALALAGQPAGFWHTPGVPGFGHVHVWKGVNTVFLPNKHTTYKALFDITKSKHMDKLNGSLGHAARTVNAFAIMGVPLRNLKFALVVHGPATSVVLSAKAFKAKFGYANPNLKVIDALAKAGVDLTVCGNALADNGYTPSEVNPKFKIALSAISTLVILQDKGYALMRF